MRDRAFTHKPDPVQTSLRNLKLEQRDHGRALGKLRSSLQTPTHPIYDEEGPLDPVETQIAWRGEKLAPEFYRQGAWHPFGESMGAGEGIFKHIAIQGIGEIPALGGFPEPFDELRTAEPDAEIFEAVLSPEPHTGIKILQAGLYLVRAEIRWPTDRAGGSILCFPDIGLTGLADFLAGFGEQTQKSAYYFGEGSALSPVIGINLVHEGILKVSKPGDGILLRTEVTRTAFDGAIANVPFQQFAMRLSPNPNADQS